MSAEQVARAHYFARLDLAGRLSRLARRLWASVDAADLDGSWARVLPEILLGLSGAQLLAARQADTYVTTALTEQGIPTDAAGALVPESLAGIASDGRGLQGLLRNPITVVKAGLAGGATVDQSMAAGYANLGMLTHTQLADAGRVADGVALTSRPAATGYVRMLVGDSCSRCVVLAGRNYGWNTGFERHPSCDCVHVPAAEDSADDVRTDPRGYFDGLTRAEQDKAFTKAGAQAIREGADIAKVVNARRGIRTAADGRLYTTEAAGRRPRLMPEQIYREAGDDRDEAIRLLRLHGYLKTPAPDQRRAPRPAAPAQRPAPAHVVTKGSDRLDAEAARLNADVAAFDAAAKRMQQAKFDVMLGELGARQGFDGLPQVGTRAELDAAVASGWPELWRGVVGGWDSTPADINGRLRTGAYEPGKGLYGNGWYTSERRNTAETFRGRDPKTNLPAGGGPDFEPSDLEGDEEPDSMIRLALNPAARIIDYDELVVLRDRWLTTQPSNTPARKMFADPGRFATALGYDAVRVSVKHGDGGFYPGWEDSDDTGGAVQIVILNRTAVLIQRAEDAP